MIYFIGAAGFCLITVCSLCFSIYLYWILQNAVREGREVPGWMYRIGHAIIGRGRDSYEDLPDHSALRELNLFLLGLAAANLLFFLYMRLYKGLNANAALYSCLKAEFFLILSVRMLWTAVKIGIEIVLCFGKKAGRTLRNYASGNAVFGMIFMSGFFLLLSLMLSGVPERAPELRIEKSRIVIGSTRASELLRAGFRFYEESEENEESGERGAEDEIRKPEDRHFYYDGELAELRCGGNPYGTVCLTPPWGKSAKLKDCIISFYRISSENPRFSEIAVCGRELSDLRWEEIRERPLSDIFSLSPANYREDKWEGNCKLQLQMQPYMLWKRYTIELRFHEDGTAAECILRAQHTLWE